MEVTLPSKSDTTDFDPPVYGHLGMRPELVVRTPEDERAWIEIEPNVWFRPLFFDMNSGSHGEVLRVRRGGRPWPGLLAGTPLYDLPLPIHNGQGATAKVFSAGDSFMTGSATFTSAWAPLVTGGHTCKAGGKVRHFSSLRYTGQIVPNTSALTAGFDTAPVALTSGHATLVLRRYRNVTSRLVFRRDGHVIDDGHTRDVHRRTDHPMDLP